MSSRRRRRRRAERRLTKMGIGRLPWWLIVLLVLAAIAIGIARVLQ